MGFEQLQEISLNKLSLCVVLLNRLSRHSRRVGF